MNLDSKLWVSSNSVYAHVVIPFIPNPIIQSALSSWCVNDFSQNHLVMLCGWERYGSGAIGYIWWTTVARSASGSVVRYRAMVRGKKRVEQVWHLGHANAPPLANAHSGRGLGGT